MISWLEKLKHRIMGKLSGEIVYAMILLALQAERQGHLRLNDGQLQLQTPMFGFSSVDLQNIDMEVELHNGKITTVSTELAGSEVKGSMNGFIQLQADIKRSQLNLTGTLEPLAEFYKNYPEIRELLKSMRKRVKRGQYFFAITGTLGEPRFKLL